MKNFVRLKLIILGQKISETFCPLLKFFVRTLNARGGAMSDSDSDEDALVDDVYAYLVQKSYPKGCSGTRKRQIRKRAERFLVKEGNLYYRFKKEGKQVQTHALAKAYFRLHCLVMA